MVRSMVIKHLSLKTKALIFLLVIQGQNLKEMKFKKEYQVLDLISMEKTKIKKLQK